LRRIPNNDYNLLSRLRSSLSSSSTGGGRTLARCSSTSTPNVSIMTATPVPTRARSEPRNWLNNHESEPPWITLMSRSCRLPIVSTSVRNCRQAAWIARSGSRNSDDRHCSMTERRCSRISRTDSTHLYGISTSYGSYSTRRSSRYWSIEAASALSPGSSVQVAPPPPVPRTVGSVRPVSRRFVSRLPMRIRASIADCFNGVTLEVTMERTPYDVGELQPMRKYGNHLKRSSFVKVVPMSWATASLPTMRLPGSPPSRACTRGCHRPRPP
jgi:hypothetical protein